MMEPRFDSSPDLSFEVGEIDQPAGDNSGERRLKSPSTRKPKPEDVPVENAWQTRRGVGGDAPKLENDAEAGGGVRVSEAGKERLRREAEMAAFQLEFQQARAKVLEERERTAQRERDRKVALEKHAQEVAERQIAVRDILGAERARNWVQDNQDTVRKATKSDRLFVSALADIDAAILVSMPARIATASPDQVTRNLRSEQVVFDDRGVPWHARSDGVHEEIVPVLKERGRTSGARAEVTGAETHQGLRRLHEDPLRSEIISFLRQRFDVRI